MIDLHLHTTASDGHLTPGQLVAEAHAAGITTLAVTDHDTVAALPAASAAAGAAGLVFVPGIEMTAVHQARDIHILGYFLDASDPALAAFLRTQREARRRRLVAMVDRLDMLGITIDRVHIEASVPDEGRALGRPFLAAALVAGGHARDIADAFDRYLAAGRPAFVRRQGPGPSDVIAEIRRTGGIASLAHPGKLQSDAIIGGLVAAGLQAIEVYHPDHDEAAVARYRLFADQHGLLVTGGSDYHGPETGRAEWFGRVGLPGADFDALVGRHSRR